MLRIGGKPDEKQMAARQFKRKDDEKCHRRYIPSFPPAPSGWR